MTAEVITLLPIRFSCSGALAAAAELVSALEEVGKSGVELFDPAVAFEVHLDFVPASRAGEQRVRLEPTVAFFEFLRALGACDAVLDAIAKAFSHEVVSEGGVATPTVARAGEGL